MSCGRAVLISDYVLGDCLECYLVTVTIFSLPSCLVTWVPEMVFFVR